MFFWLLSKNLIFIQKINKLKQNIFEKKVNNKIFINSSHVYILPMKVVFIYLIHGISYTSTYTTTHFNILCFGFFIFFSLQQNVFLVTNFSEEKFFVTENLHLATKFEFRHKK